MQINDSGVKPKNAPQKYVKMYPKVQGPLLKVVTWLKSIGCSIDMKDATALWMVMICQPYLDAPENPELWPKLLVMDNFYTRHFLGLGISKLSQGMVKIIGTVKKNLICAHLKQTIADLVEILKNADRGVWYLVKCFQQQTPIGPKEKGKRKALDPVLVPSPHCGYIIFKDKKPCLFYTNDLQGTLSLNILSGYN